MTVSNFKLLILCLAVISVVSLATVFANRKSEYRRGVSLKADTAVGQASELYKQKKLEGINFENGPCLSNDLLDDWVVDIVHNPRQKQDDLPENQCTAYIEGRAKHFVELDPQGEVVRVK